MPVDRVKLAQIARSALAAKVTRLTEKLTKLKEEMASLPFTRSRCLLRLTRKSH
jgi:hypothetical protein